MSETKLFLNEDRKYFLISEIYSTNSCWDYAGKFECDGYDGVFAVINMIDNKVFFDNITIHYNSIDEMAQDLLGLTDTNECVNVSAY